MSSGSDTPIIGLHCKAYCGPSGLTIDQLAIPENEMALLRTANLNLTKATADVTTRGSTWRLQVGTLKEGTIEGELLITRNGRESEMFMRAWNEDFPLSMFISNGFGEGLFGDFSVLNMSQNQPLEDVIIANYSVSPTLTDRYPEWIKTAAGVSPIITSPPEFVGVVGDEVSFQLTANPAADTWSAIDLPDGLTLSSSSGLITGQVDREMVCWPYVTATNESGSMTRMIQIVIR